MSKLTHAETDRIAQNCINVYNKLPKTGKPIDKEWTVLSCVVQYDSSNGKQELVSLGTGSKCIGASKMSSSGDVLNDSHAEICARRGFLVYLYDNIEKASKNQTSIFNYEKKFKLKDGKDFIFFSSQLPCGDASIVPMNAESEHFGDLLELKKRKAVDNNICDVEKKKAKLRGDLHRTGAKCLPGLEQDPKESGLNYHLLGQVRTKPGRGDRTLSVSCSDKMAKWVHLGVQGSLLDMLCEPIYIKHFIFGGGVQYSEESLNRALLRRQPDMSLPKHLVPEIYQCSVRFPHARSKDTKRAAPGSITWIKLNNPILEVAVQGKKLGVTKKNANTPSKSLCISKFKLYERFLNILLKNSLMKQKLFGDESIDNLPYNEMKRKSERYITNWLQVKNIFFKSWTVKPDIWNFRISDL